MMRLLITTTVLLICASRCPADNALRIPTHDDWQEGGQTRDGPSIHSNPIARHPASRLYSTTSYPTCGKNTLVCKQQVAYTGRTRKTLFVRR
jgi:hypothetical protein